MTLIALVTGASSDFNQMIARDLAKAGHTAYASMRDAEGKNADKVGRMRPTPKSTGSTRARSPSTSRPPPRPGLQSTASSPSTADRRARAQRRPHNLRIERSVHARPAGTALRCLRAGTAGVKSVGNLYDFEP